jgi:hypothetical protein
LQVQVDGFVGASLIYSNPFTLETTQPTFVELDYQGVDKVVFGIEGADRLGSGQRVSFRRARALRTRPSKSRKLSFAFRTR